MSAQPKVASLSAQIALGVDDGYYNTKVVGPNGAFVTESRARIGTANVVAFADSDVNVCEYETDNVAYAVGKINADNTAFDDYPTDPLNRIIVHHALLAAGYGGREVTITTGLPVRLYYKRGRNPGKNEDLIARKIENLSKPVTLTKGQPHPSVTDAEVVIAKHHVIPEGFAAWFDYLIEEDAKGNVKRHTSREKEAVAFIDIGGRTTDYAVIADRAVQLDASGSIDVGMLKVNELVHDEICAEYNLASLKSASVDAAVKDGLIRLHGKDVDVRDIVSHAKREVVEQIKQNTKRLIGSRAAELERVIFIGGGVDGLRGHLSGWFSNQIVMENPVFANARGMGKYMNYVAAE